MSLVVLNFITLKVNITLSVFIASYPALSDITTLFWFAKGLSIIKIKENAHVKVECLSTAIMLSNLVNPASKYMFKNLKKQNKKAQGCYWWICSFELVGKSSEQNFWVCRWLWACFYLVFKLTINSHFSSSKVKIRSFPINFWYPLCFRPFSITISRIFAQHFKQRFVSINRFIFGVIKKVTMDGFSFFFWRFLFVLWKIKTIGIH